MSAIDSMLDDLKDQLQVAMPSRQVTRRWRDRDDYDKASLCQGVITLVFRGEHEAEENYHQSFRLLIVGLLRLDHKAKGDEVEKAELELREELREFSMKHGALRIMNTVTSHQVETPDGWFVAECEYGPYYLGPEIHSWEDGYLAEPDLLTSQKPDIGIPHKDDYENAEHL